MSLPSTGSPVEMKAWYLGSCLILSYSLSINMVDTAPLDYLHRFRASLANFDNLNPNTNPLTSLANLEAVDVCHGVENSNQV